MDGGHDATSDAAEERPNLSRLNGAAPLTRQAPVVDGRDMCMRYLSAVSVRACASDPGVTRTRVSP